MPKNFPLKPLPDGRTMLNIGCGWKMHWGWTNLDFSPYAKLVTRPWMTGVLRRFGLLTAQRQERLAKVDPQIICWDLRHGIPYPDGSFDVVYHSHFLEHLDRNVAPIVLRECLRVLKVGGVIRVVVPDWERLAHAYLKALGQWDQGAPEAGQAHQEAMEELIDQMVRVEATGSRRSGALGRLENWWRGGATGTGELHKWMYDRRSLAALLESVGFTEARPETVSTSRIGDWNSFGLDTNDSGAEYKAGSLYVEAAKPGQGIKMPI